MKITVDGHTITTRCVRSQACPDGLAYWGIEYCLDDETVYSTQQGPTRGTPSAIMVLDKIGKLNKTHREHLLDLLALVIK